MYSFPGSTTQYSRTPEFLYNLCLIFRSLEEVDGDRISITRSGPPMQPFNADLVAIADNRNIRLDNSREASPY